MSRMTMSETPMLEIIADSGGALRRRSGGTGYAGPAQPLIKGRELAVLDLDDVDLLGHVLRGVERELAERRLHARGERELIAKLVVQHARHRGSALQRVEQDVQR